MAKNNYRKGDLGGMAFVAMPLIVLDSPDYLELSPSATKLLIDVYRQYSGINNGRLSPCWELMRKRGWKSQTTLNNAKKELRQTRLITVTKAGTRQKGNPELWAVNWRQLDWRKDMDIQPTGFDYKGFLDLKAAKIDPIPERSKSPELKIVA